MVALDEHYWEKPDTGAARLLSAPLLTAILAAAVTFATIAANGFGENALRLGSQAAWRFAFLVFFVLLVAGPVCRLGPFAICRALGPHLRQLVFSFCAAMAVYFGSLIVPNTIRPVGVTHEGMDAGMMLFAFFSGALTAAMAYAAGLRAALALGEKARRAILAIAAIYFWLCYSLTALARISGPHRPDLFYGTSLALMILALLLRFTDRFVAKWRQASNSEAVGR
jgi:hypothetical protein